jgi:hypothetical protein
MYILMNPQDYQDYLSHTEKFVRRNPKFQTKVRAVVQPNKDVPQGTAYVSGEKVEVK